MLFRLIVAGVVVACATSSVLLAGDLNPPAGPVAATMKPLDAIESRTCVSELPGSADAVHVISESGRYFLTGDILGAPGKHAILVESTALDVSIDLNGCSLIGVPASLNGVHVQDVDGNSGFDRAVFIFSEPVAFGGGRGVVTRFGGDGIHVEGARALRISGVAADDNGGDGIDATCYIPSTGKYEGFFDLRSVSTMSNGGNGVRVEAPALASVSAKVFSSDVNSCMNGLDGFHAADFDEVRLARVQSLSNGDDGVDVTLTTHGAREGFFDIVASASNFNVGHGVAARAGTTSDGTTTLEKCFWSGVTACGNGLDGFHDDGSIGLTVEQCSSAKNGGVGFYKVYQPGQPVYGNIAFSDSSATENALGGAALYVPVDSDFSVTVAHCAFNDNGHSQGGTVGPGLLIESSGGSPDPARKRRVWLDMKDSDVIGNSGDGARVRSGHDIAMNSIRNMKAMVNGGSGVDVGPVDGATLFDIVVDFTDIFCSHNAVDGLIVRGATGGNITDCRADKNGGVGLGVVGAAIPGGSVLSSALRIDQCFASYNTTGIYVEGENIVLRSGGSHNTGDNMVLAPDVFAGPNAVAPSWIVTKPYAWP